MDYQYRFYERLKLLKQVKSNLHFWSMILKHATGVILYYIFTDIIYDFESRIEMIARTSKNIFDHEMHEKYFARRFIFLNKYPLFICMILAFNDL